MVDHCTILRVKCFLCGPRIASCIKKWPGIHAVIGWIVLVSHHLGVSPLGAIELTVLWAFVCIVQFFDG